MLSKSTTSGLLAGVADTFFSNRCCSGLWLFLTAIVITGCSDGRDNPPAITFPEACATEDPIAFTSGADEQPFAIDVALDEVTQPANHGVAGVASNIAFELSNLLPLRPPFVRTDAALGSISPSPDSELQLDDLLDRVAAIRELGAEPMLILSYTPRWMGEARAQGCTVQVVGGPCAADRMRPEDLDVWEEFIFNVVRAVATAPDNTTYFEVWNEPDVAAVFWHDTPEAFLEMAVRTHKAIQRVELETGIDLKIGGPTISEEYLDLFDAVLLETYVEAIIDNDLPLDFVSWHHYANSPLLGPDGNEGFLPDDLYEAISGLNPDTTPAVYGELVRDYRARVRSVMPTGATLPEFVISEWNLSGGGFDLRHGTNEGAAFVLASMIEMEREGVDHAMLFRAVGGDNPGDFGLAREDGSKKPTWHVLNTWLDIEGGLLDSSGDAPDEGIWARAVRSGSNIEVLLANFRAVEGEAVPVSLGLEGDCGPAAACIGFLDETSSQLAQFKPILPVAGRYQFEMPRQSISRLQFSCSE